MSLVKNKDKRTGITYVYESESYWDKEKQQPRSRRTLIGKLDETTGEIVPTDGRGHKRKPRTDNNSNDTTLADNAKKLEQLIKDQEQTIASLKAENLALKAEKEKFIKQLNALIAKY